MSSGEAEACRQPDQRNTYVLDNHTPPSSKGQRCRFPTLKWQLNAPPQTSGLCREACLPVMVLHLLRRMETGGLAATNRHMEPASLFTGGRSVAFLLCHSEESTNMRRDLKSHRSRFPFLTLQTCSDNDGAAGSRNRPPPPLVSALGWSPLGGDLRGMLLLPVWSPVPPEDETFGTELQTCTVSQCLSICNLATEYVVCVPQN